ncbi:hemerythrin domain-containing protein [Pseudaminobacter soli (ex Li et al. 2025)]|uniref:Hemerythrin-like domain-containing protein n=1 Tax=Pseudaminobacter soli (ex Li et al. 2025) TaxID=1295366 RepID=A0A2P7S2E6_9HYPH|nr:hemerythrin domain-containing protein [Mesorhizobium soli]PSJ56632.1 hypothetical protein C7I85_24030 [Mesorhizobium soli]
MPHSLHLTKITDLNDRHDIYGPIHKGLRKAQCDLLARLGNVDFGDARATADLLSDMRALLVLAAAHLEHEDRHIHDALRTRGAASVDRLDHQHDDHRATFAELETLLASIEAASAEERPGLGRRLYLAFGTYVAHDLEHMHEEETVAAPQLWSLFSDAEMMAIENRIVGSLPPEKAMAFMRLMIPAINPAERAALLGGMKQQAPREAFDAVIEFAARPNLSAAEFADLARRLDLVA